MEQNISAKRRIAQNTAFLYLRMLVVMGVTFFTSCVVLASLGETDYGIYGAVGGVVTMYTFISGSLSASTSRFLTYELGRNDSEALSHTFSAALNLHLIAALFILLIGETLGAWFLYEKMTIPEARMDAAYWILQFSIITTTCDFILVPFRASVISHENMSLFAYIGLYEAFSVLIIAYLIQIGDADRLVFYGALLMGNKILILLFHILYTRRRYVECRMRIVREKALYTKLLSYSGWNMFGHVASLSQGQGINIVLNMFCGPAVNAARGLAVTIQSGLLSFIGNFLTAVRPRVVKLYAEGNNASMYRLTFMACKISYFLMFALIMPLAFEMDFVLRIWLGDNVPQYTGIFARIILGVVLVESFHSAYLMAFHAIGKMKMGNMVCGSLMILTLPAGYIALKMGLPPYSVFVIILANNVVCHVFSWVLTHRYVPFSYWRLATAVYLPCILVTLCALPVPAFVHANMQQGWPRFLALSLCSELVYALFIYTFGFSKAEKEELIYPVWRKIRNRIKRIR